METRASYVIVGSFVLAFFVAIVGAVVWLADLELEDDRTRFDVFFEGSVSGLSVGNAVRYNGIPIGTVVDMRLREDRFGEVQVVIEIPSDTPLREDAIAKLEYQGITGLASIQLNGGTETAEPLRRRPGQRRAEIQSEQSSLQQVFDTAPEILESLQTLAAQANKLLNDQNLEKITGALDNIETFSGALSDSSSGVSDILTKGAETMEQLRRTAVEGERLVTAFADRADDLALSSSITLSEAQELVKDVRQFTARLDAIAEQAQPVVGKVGQAVDDVVTITGGLSDEITLMTTRLQTTLDRVDSILIKTDDGLQDVFADARTSLTTINTLADDLSTTSIWQINAVGEQAQQTLKRFSDIADGVQPVVQQVGRDASVAMSDFREISGAMRAAAVSIGNAADEAEQLLAENREPLTNFSNAGLYEFTQLLAEMRILVGSLTRISTQLERNPAQFLFGDSQKGFEVQ